MTDSNAKKFVKGRNALKGKAAGAPKQLSKAKELERKKVCFALIEY